MSQTDPKSQPRGDFYAPLYRYKQPGDNNPMFKGHITAPGDDAKIPLALWAHRYSNPTTAPPMDQIHAMLAANPDQAETIIGNLKLRPGQVVMFPNGFKAEAPEKNRPDLWGWVVPHDGTEPFKVSVWFKQFEDGRAYMSGATTYHQPGRSEAEMQDGLAAANKLIADGAVTRGMPKAKGRGGRGE
jgi:hypothetical protein